jgi:hypothetical protein
MFMHLIARFYTCIFMPIYACIFLWVCTHVLYRCAWVFLCCMLIGLYVCIFMHVYFYIKHRRFIPSFYFYFLECLPYFVDTLFVLKYGVEYVTPIYECSISIYLCIYWVYSNLLLPLSDQWKWAVRSQWADFEMWFKHQNEYENSYFFLLWQCFVDVWLLIIDTL